MFMMAIFSTQKFSIVCLLNEINTIASMIADNISKIEDNWNTMEIWVSRVTFFILRIKSIFREGSGHEKYLFDISVSTI